MTNSLPAATVLLRLLSFSSLWPVSQLKPDWPGAQPTHHNVCLDFMNLQTYSELHFGEINLSKMIRYTISQPTEKPAHRTHSQSSFSIR